MTKVYDFHVHIGNSAALYVDGSDDICLINMDKQGVDAACISPIPGFEDPNGIADALAMNKLMYDLKQKQSRYVAALGVAEPNHGKGAFLEVDQALGELKLDGVMFHNDFNGVEVGAPVMFDIFREISKYKDAVVMLHTAFHSDLEPPFMIGRLAEKFPDMKIVVVHPLMKLIQCKAILPVLKAHPQLLIDTCYTFYHNDVIKMLVDEIGSERMLFGSDNPYYGNLCVDKELVKTADITEQDKENIFCHTFEKLFSIT